MNKENIYQIIGYQGKYTESVRKALKKLLKDNHPDHGGDAYIFKMITEVKKELETDNVSYKIKANSKIRQYDDIDYDYCHKMMIKLSKEERQLQDELNNIKESIDILDTEYEKIYRKSIEKETTLMNNGEINKLNSLKKQLVFLLVILIITFVIAIISGEIILFAIFAIVCVITVFAVYSFYKIFSTINEKSKNKINKYIELVNKIRKITNDRELLKKEIMEKERKLNNIQNDLRFYHNVTND